MSSFNKEKILNEIRDKGVQVKSINDLIKIDKKYKDLIPIILKYLVEASDETDKSWLVRCLGVNGFTEATDVLIDEYYKASNRSSLKWTIGNTLSIILDKNSVDALLKIAQEKEHGTSRQMVIVALGKLRNKKAIPVLLKLLYDEEVVAHVIWALSYFKDPSLIPFIEPFVNSKRPLVHNEAKKAIKKLSN